MVTSVMGLDPERLNIFVRSLRRYSPATHLVVFVEQNTSHALLEANGAEVIPFKMEEGSALVLHRCARAGGALAGWVSAGAAAAAGQAGPGAWLCCRVCQLELCPPLPAQVPAICY